MLKSSLKKVNKAENIFRDKTTTYDAMNRKQKKINDLLKYSDTNIILDEAEADVNSDAFSSNGVLKIFIKFGSYIYSKNLRYASSY